MSAALLAGGEHVPVPHEGLGGNQAYHCRHNGTGSRSP